MALALRCAPPTCISSSTACSYPGCGAAARRPTAAAATPLRRWWAGGACERQQPVASRALPAVVQAEMVQQEVTAEPAAAAPARHSRRLGKLQGPCANVHCGTVESRQFFSASNPRLVHFGLEGAVCSRCYTFFGLYGRLPDFPRGAGAKPGRPVKGQRLTGPCANPACGVEQAAGPWYAAAGQQLAQFGLQGAVCRRCHEFARRNGRLPDFPPGQRPKLTGPCSNTACGAEHTSGNWYSAPDGSGVHGTVCSRCYNRFTSGGRWPDTPPRKQLPVGSVLGPCANAACGAQQSKRWDTAPAGSDLEDSVVCHRCRVYWDLYGRWPSSPKKVLTPRGSLHGPCANVHCGAEQTSAKWCSAPAGSGLEGAICHRCYMAYRTKGSLPTKPNARLRRVLAGLQQRQGGETGSS